MNKCCGVDPDLITDAFLRDYGILQESRTRIIYIIAATLLGYQVINIQEQALLNTVRPAECQVSIPNIYPMQCFTTVWTVYGVSYFYNQEKSTYKNLRCNPDVNATSLDLCIHKNEVINYELIILVLLRRMERLQLEHAAKKTITTPTNPSSTN